MIVSALLTSVGINFGLCVLFFTLYSILRRQPPNYDVYAPRLLAEKKTKESLYFHLDRLLPSPGWVMRAWKLSEDDLLAISGLDAVVFMRIIIFSLRVLSFAGIVGVFALLPVNISGDQLADFNISNISSDSLDIFTISNVNDGSNRLWAHFSAIYLVTVFACYLLYYEYNYISSKRVAYFYSSKPQPHQFTILVRSIPISPGGTVGESVDTFFTEYYPSTYLSHVVVRKTSRLQNLINETNNLYRRVTHLRVESSQSTTTTNSGFFGLFKKKASLVDQYEKKLGDLEENMRVERQASLAGEDVRAAFVFFKSRYGAAMATNIQQAENPTRWNTEQAPDPRDVHWPFFQSSFFRRWVSKVVAFIVSIFLTVVFFIPVVLVQSLANLNQLETLFPFLKSILSLTVVSEIVTGYLPSLILQLFMTLVPPVMVFLSSIQGYFSHSEIQKSACIKFLWFTIWNIFFANVLSGSILNELALFLDLKNIPAKLAVSVPAEASFFISYVVTSGWTSTSSELFRMFPFCGRILQKWCCCCCAKKSTDEESEVPAIPYHVAIPRLLFFGLLGITYFFLAPLILPFLLVYFCLAYIVFRNQFLNVYEPKFDTAGKFWPIVHNSMIFSLVLMHAIAVGIFTLKKLPLASTLVFPLPILTLLFNEYCRKRFLPNFTGYSVESLIKKDREDVNDPSMTEFFNKLATSYKDPALAPLQFSNPDSRTTPLLLEADA